MITNWTIGHFKSIYDITNFEFAPLTIFAGENSSGKSTLIQTLLLVTQTVQSQIQTRSVVLNGHIARLGTFSDILSHRSQENEIKIGFALDIDEGLQRRESFGWRGRTEHPIRSVELNFTFSSSDRDSSREKVQLQPPLQSCSLRATFREDRPPVELVLRRSDVGAEERASELEVEESAGPNLRSALSYVVESLTGKGRSRSYGDPATGKPVGAFVRHFLPLSLTLVFDEVEEHVRQVVRQITFLRDVGGGSDIENIEEALTPTVEAIVVDSLEKAAKVADLQPPRHNLFSRRFVRLQKDFSLHDATRAFGYLPPEAKRTFQRLMIEREDEIAASTRGDQPPKPTLTYSRLSEGLDEGSDYIRQFFLRNVKYLGPLRDEPKPIYPLAGPLDPTDIGFKGEHTAATLELHKFARVRYVPSRCFEDSSQGPHEIQEASLLDAVHDWLRYMGVASQVATTDRGGLGHEMKIAAPDSESLHDLTHVGVGVSQVLPILVLALLAEPGSTLIFEQPELHLHPKVQTRLGDFFLSMTSLNKQCVVETHSEYLINRLRLHSALSDDEELASRVMIYFVESRSGRSQYTPIRISPTGSIPHWPKGFFDEGDDIAASLLKAALDRQRKKPKVG